MGGRSRRRSHEYNYTVRFSRGPYGTVQVGLTAVSMEDTIPYGREDTVHATMAKAVGYVSEQFRKRIRYMENHLGLGVDSSGVRRYDHPVEEGRKVDNS